MTSFRNKSVLITGAGAGIGRLMSVMIASEGASALYLWDLNEQGLNETCRLITNRECRLSPLVIDVTDREKVFAEAARIETDTRPVEMLINNAGVIFGGQFAGQPPDAIDRTIAVNLTAVMQVTRAFLPQILARPKGHIVNIASAAGLVTNPGMAVYNASKWGVIGWSESLRLELERSGSRVRVTTVTPFYISTGMFDGVSSNPLLPIIKPEKAALKILRGIKRNKLFVRMPWLIYITPFARGILPARWFDWLVGGVMGVYHSMDSFKGHKP